MKRTIDYNTLGLQIVADECRKSFFYFVKTFWDVIIKEVPVYNWHIPFLCGELEKILKPVVERKPKLYDLIINIPPGTTKSTIVTIMFPVWAWTQDPTIRIITNSYSGDLAIEHSTKSKDIITSEKFKKLFPDILIRKDKSAKSSYENTYTGARYTASTGGTITGKHAHLIINDDPINPKQAMSEALRLQANEHTKTLASRKVDKAITPVITIMQRLHEEDVTGYLLQKKSENIKLICLPAENSENVKPAEVRKFYIDGLLDPLRLSRRVLEEAKTDLGSRAYSGQYEQNPVADGGNIIKKEWFKFCTVADFNRLYDGQPIHFFVDSAYTAKNDNDPSGIIGACKIGNDMYITCAQKVLMEFPQLIRFIPRFCHSHGYTTRSTLRIEPKANGLSIIQQLKENTELNVTKTPSPTDDKETRTNATAPSVECGKVILVVGPWNEEFIEEVCGFPAKMHDEYVDLLCYASDYFIKNSFKPIDKKRTYQSIY